MERNNYANPFESAYSSQELNNPPPQYTELATTQPPPEKQAPPINNQQTTVRTSSQIQQPSNSTSRLLHIYHDGITHRHMTIVDSNKQTTLYTITANGGSLFSTKPHISIAAGPNSNLVGTITFPSFSRHLNLEIHNRTLTVDSAGWLSSAHVFRSAANEETLTWERESMFGSGLVLNNSKGQWIAKFNRSVFATSKVGKLELPGPEVSGLLLDEVVVTAIAVSELARRKRQNSACAAGAGGGC